MNIDGLGMRLYVQSYYDRCHAAQHLLLAIHPRIHKCVLSYHAFPPRRERRNFSDQRTASRSKSRFVACEHSATCESPDIRILGRCLMFIHKLSFSWLTGFFKEIVCHKE